MAHKGVLFGNWFIFSLEGGLPESAAELGDALIHSSPELVGGRGGRGFFHLLFDKVVAAKVLSG